MMNLRFNKLLGNSGVALGFSRRISCMELVKGPFSSFSDIPHHSNDPFLLYVKNLYSFFLSALLTTDLLSPLY
jgi:hypothetical protein